MTGLSVTEPPEGVGAEGGDTSCTTPDISADNLRIARPPARPLPEEVELLMSAAAKVMMPTGVAPVAVNPVEAAADGVPLIGVSGTVAPILLRDTGGSSGGDDGTELTDGESDRKGSTDARGRFCGFRISR